MTVWLTALLAAAAVAVLVPAGRSAIGWSEGRAGSSGVVPDGSRSRRPWGRRREMVATRAAVLEVCDLLAAELASGRPPGAALAAAREAWPPLAPVVEASRLGADVPDSMRRLAVERRGAADLQWVAGAWQVAQDSGHGLASALERTSGGLRAHRRTRRLVDSELASARATARLVASLPLAVLLMGSGAGSDPWAFLVGTPVGWLCLTLGLGLIGLGLWWIERLADRASSW